MFGIRESLLSKLLLLVCLIGLCFSSQVFADTQQVVDYQYDSAGNIIGVRVGQNLAPPDVTDLSPPFINRESFAFVTATGINLTKATVTLNAIGVTLIDVTNVSETEIRFTLFADNTATIGNVPVTFTTRLGTDVENVVVAERTPIVSTDPNPIILMPNSEVVDVHLSFDQPFATDQTFDIAITDETVATVSDQTVTLAAGETEVSTTITGLVVGSTTLEINQLSNFLALGIPVIVNNDQLPTGNYAFYATSISVSAYIPPSLNTNGIFATQRPLGVAIYTEPTLNTTGVFATQRPVGVAAYLQPSLNTTGLFATQTPLGTTLGTTINQVTPATVSRGTSEILILDGFELNSVTTISFNPGDGITQTAAFSVTPDGSQMTIPISVTPDASTGVRAVELTTTNGTQLNLDGVFTIQ